MEYTLIKKSFLTGISLENFNDGHACTSPSGEKLKADIIVVTTISDVPESKLGRPGGPLASKTFNLVTLCRKKIDIVS